ncbi:DUF397 domain-containing protein [Nocardiopsis algeriensis]|uniref:DUF397 domain-containing protein n=1 Tax=Nocardiopsis algeriensis TaxID=1478215 RepID=UPI003B42E8C7
MHSLWSLSARMRGGTMQDCVELADLKGGAGTVRDTQNRDLGTLVFGSAEWRALLNTLKADRS